MIIQHLMAWYKRLYSIMDLVEGHLDALKFVSGKKGSFAFNLGSEKGYSVLELIDSLKM